QVRDEIRVSLCIERAGVRGRHRRARHVEELADAVPAPLRHERDALQRRAERAVVEVRAVALPALLIVYPTAGVRLRVGERQRRVLRDGRRARQERDRGGERRPRRGTLGLHRGQSCGATLRDLMSHRPSTFTSSSTPRPAAATRGAWPCSAAPKTVIQYVWWSAVFSSMNSMNESAVMWYIGGELSLRFCPRFATICRSASRPFVALPPALNSPSSV